MRVAVRWLCLSFIVPAAMAAEFTSPARGDGQRQAARKPNLVFVMSEQHSWDMLGCYGNQDVKTPNFDRLAKQGLRFTHCISNSPVCTSYRGILMSGQHPLYCGAMENDLQMLPGNGEYSGEVLRDAGYHTGYDGKWHLYGADRKRPVPPGPFRYGFDHEFLTNNCTLLWVRSQSAPTVC
ncbi:MAG: sulfatase-like hydrolase/transferase [Pirellulaceae bacterium]